MEKFFKKIEASFPDDFISRAQDDLIHYGRDWTREIPPNASAVVFPRSTEEVSKFLKICFENNVAVVPSGGRTGLSGGALAANGEVVLSLEKMNKIFSIDVLSQTMRVQAGVVTESVHEFCSNYDLTWPIDFGSKGSSHVGGNIATNAGGIKVLQYGMTRNWVLGITVVKMDGEVMELNGALEKNNSGPDWKHLFIGSEGILGVVTEAVLRLVPIPKNLDLFFISLKNIENVLKLLEFTRKSGINLFAFECMAKNCFLASIAEHKIRSPFSAEQEQYVLIELKFLDGEIGDQQKNDWVEELLHSGLIVEAVLACSDEQKKDFWKIRESIAEVLAKISLNHKNDVSVPTASLKAFLEDWESLYRSKYKNLNHYIYGHIGDGNLHVSALMPAHIELEEFRTSCKKFDEDLFGLVKKYHGSISAEHGLGLLKKPYAHYSKSESEIAILRAMKKHLDPKGLLNPGKVVDI